MLKVLSYSVEFPTTGRRFENEIEFAPGLTAITGRNEAGKTLVLEMIGYCLFGKDALRGAASDYKNLKANLKLAIAGDEVEIDRAKKEVMTVNGDIVAVGAAAINKEVPMRLGFGLDVFNVACASQQGDIGRLTEMRPTARLAMVDRLTGLDQLEEVEKKCKNEATTHKGVAQGLILSAREPEPPVKPDDYEPSPNLMLRIKEIEEHQRERARLLMIPEPVEPVAPVAPEHTNVEELEAHENLRQTVLREQAHVQGQLSAIPVPRHTREELQKALDYREYAQELVRRGPKPEYTLEQLDEWEQTHAKLSLKRQLHPIDCPSCNHTFVPDRPDVDLAALADLVEPPVTLVGIARDRRHHAMWAEPLAEVPIFNIDNIEQEIIAHARAEERADLCARAANFDVPAVDL